MSQTNAAKDRGPTFDGVKVDRPATGALIDAGHESLAGLPEELDQLADLHGVGPRAVHLLKEARSRYADRDCGKIIGRDVRKGTLL